VAVISEPQESKGLRDASWKSRGELGAQGNCSAVRGTKICFNNAEGGIRTKPAHVIHTSRRTAGYGIESGGKSRDPLDEEKLRKSIHPAKGRENLLAFCLRRLSKLRMRQGRGLDVRLETAPFKRGCSLSEKT